MADDQGSSSIGLMPSELVGTIFDQKAVSEAGRLLLFTSARQGQLVTNVDSTESSTTIPSSIDGAWADSEEHARWTEIIQDAFEWGVHIHLSGFVFDTMLRDRARTKQPPFDDAQSTTGVWNPSYLMAILLKPSTNTDDVAKKLNCIKNHANRAAIRQDFSARDALARPEFATAMGEMLEATVRRMEEKVAELDELKIRMAALIEEQKSRMIDGAGVEASAMEIEEGEYTGEDVRPEETEEDCVEA